MSKIISSFICQNCGQSSSKWIGKCPGCGEWNTMVEEVVASNYRKTSRNPRKKVDLNLTNLKKVSDISGIDEQRITTSIEELDRVLGSGLVPGSVVLVGGDPGIGKSTLMVQIADKLKQRNILYITGEESQLQIKMRCQRLGFDQDDFYVLTETNLEIIAAVIDKLEPEIVIVDSIQTVYTDIIDSSPGSISQLRESTSAFIKIAKAKSVCFLLVGHITKEGLIAGPKVLEHMVDTVLQFEGERTHIYRVLRAIKNRFGSTNEIGIFEMTGNGLNEVKNPSEVFLSNRNSGKPGSTVSASMEGTRPILIEVQALVSSSGYSVPQRTATGFDYKRLAILLAVLEKKLGLFLSRYDVFVNIAGGIKIDEPSIDIAVAMSILSSFRDAPVESTTLLLGEIGLSGEIRTISYAEKRVQEGIKLGFKKIILPSNNIKNFKPTPNVELLGAETINDVIKYIF